MRHEDTADGNVIWRAVRIVVPWIGLIIVITVLWSLVVEYRSAIEQQESTSTVVTTSTAGIPAGQPYVLVISDGLNLREQPTTTATVLMVLNADQQLAFIEEGTGWFHVRDASGVEGWVAAGGAYTQLVQP